MRVYDRLRQLASALPSAASAVILTRGDLEALLEGDDVGPGPDTFSADLKVEEVAEALGRSPSTVRGWLGAGSLRGYKLNGRDWRVPRSALRDYLDGQMATPAATSEDPSDVDIGAWRDVLGLPRKGRRPR